MSAQQLRFSFPVFRELKTAVYTKTLLAFADRQGLRSFHSFSARTIAYIAHKHVPHIEYYSRICAESIPDIFPSATYRHTGVSDDTKERSISRRFPSKTSAHNRHLIDKKARFCILDFVSQNKFREGPERGAQDL